jgi:DNA-binding transcriptional ArsR family regulator
MKSLEKQYKALANRRRLAILKYLKNHSKATVGEIAAEIKLKLKATSKHLRVLAAADFIDREQQSLHVYYFLPSAGKPSLLKNALVLL